MIQRAALALGAAALLSSAEGCVAAPSASVRPAARPGVETPSLRTAAPPLALAEAEDAIVRIVGPQTSCTGTLVDEDLVLTAHHCVVELGPRGSYTDTLVAPESLMVELGGDYLPWGNVRARAVVAAPCGSSGGAGDVALVVLSRRLVGIAPYQVRLDAPPKVGEVLDPAGFGRCARSPSGIHRSVREGGAVEGVGSGVARVTASVCPGDSGGPFFARGSHEVVGVVSLAAMDADPSTRNASVLARIDRMRPLFAAARLIADGTQKNELPPLACTR